MIQENPMSKVDVYASNQKALYARITESIEDAKDAVGQNYDALRQEAKRYVRHMLGHYALRKGIFTGFGCDELANLKAFDFGCGVGRVMEACRENGMEHVDGCDLSENMLRHASNSPGLSNSQFFLSTGFDAGGAPAGSYDIAYSFLCFHHIPMRQTRIKLLESLYNLLKPGGMVFIEFKTFPGAGNGKIPANHSHWTENRPAQDTNSAADVWITPDSLGQVAEDFRLFFNDIAIQEFDRAENLYEYQPNEIYQFGYNELFVVASKGASLKKQIMQDA